MLAKLTNLVAHAKAPKITYLVKHPIKGPKNLLALRGARSLMKTRGAALAAAGVALGAAAVPLAVMRRKMKA